MPVCWLPSRLRTGLARPQSHSLPRWNKPSHLHLLPPLLLRRRSLTDTRSKRCPVWGRSRCCFILLLTFHMDTWTFKPHHILSFSLPGKRWRILSPCRLVVDQPCQALWLVSAFSFIPSLSPPPISFLSTGLRERQDRPAPCVTARASCECFFGSVLAGCCEQ